MEELSDNKLCMCSGDLTKNRYIYKCNICGREYQKNSKGDLVQTKRQDIEGE